MIDDPMKPGVAYSDIKRRQAQEWFDGTLLSRLDDKVNDVIIVFSARRRPRLRRFAGLRSLS